MNLLELLFGTSQPEEAGPQMKNQSIAIEWVYRSGRTIYLWGEAETVNKLKKYGKLYKYMGMKKYSLEVDARYDLNEVIEYIRTLGEPDNE